ncbi:hypothetical protein ACF0H5_021529 [Mactra antiquata]
MIGAVIFIAMLLVMGGVEKNPGPHEVFNFRYQYLLIEVGTKVVRKVFDDIVGPDLYTFLTNHHAHLQLLIRRKMITCDQENLLPPIEPSPSSENFDISLLCCLLRNICGLCPPGDNVWIQPASTDKSIEANLTRIRLCRNSVAHSKSVLEEQTQLDTKWTDLSDSLKELGKKCSFTDLSKLIEKAETIEIDERLKKKFDSVLELWNEMEKMFDRGLGEITKSLAAISECQRQQVKSLEELVKGQENNRKLIMETNQSTSAGLKKIQDELGNPEFAPKRRRLNKVSRIEDIRLKLIEIYQQEFGNIQLCPSVDFESGKILDFYQLPTMHIVDYHKVDKHQTEQSHVNLAQVETCNDLFCNGDKQCKNIYLTGEAGHGKTSFSRFMTFLWCNSKLAKQLENDKLQPYADYLARIGILSKCQVFRQYGRLELKLSFLHKSYLEFFAAIFVSTLETSKVLTLFNTCKTVNDALKFKNFLIFYAGLKTKNMNLLICRIYTLMSDHLISGRNQSFVHRSSFYSLISEYMIMIRTCYVEGSCGMESPILLEDFMFADPLKFHFNADYTFESEYNTKLLRKLLCLNEKNVKYLVSRSNKYFNEFDKITNLQWLKILHSTDYDVKFNELMLRNKSSLHSVCIDGAFHSPICRTEIPLNSLPHLTSVSLGYPALPHQSLQSAVKFLSNNTHLQNVALLDVKCYEHKDDTDKCALTCDFSGCNHLESLRLKDTNIICSKINVSSLKDINLTLKSQTVANYYSDIFHCIQIASKLTSLEVDGYNKLNVHTVKHLINSIQCLHTIRRIWLTQMDIPDNVHLTLHPDNTQVNIILTQVMMSDNGFKSFIKSCTNKQSCIEVLMSFCTIRQDDGDNSTIMSKEESYDFMYNYLTSISAVTYIHKDSFYLHFRTKDCQ